MHRDIGLQPHPKDFASMCTKFDSEEVLKHAQSLACHCYPSMWWRQCSTLCFGLHTCMTVLNLLPLPPQPPPTAPPSPTSSTGPSLAACLPSSGSPPTWPWHPPSLWDASGSWHRLCRTAHACRGTYPPAHCRSVYAAEWRPCAHALPAQCCHGKTGPRTLACFGCGVEKRQQMIKF